MQIRVKYPVDINQIDARTVEFNMPSVDIGAPCLSKECSAYLAHHLSEEDLCRFEEKVFDMLTREVIVSKLVVQMRSNY